MGAAEYDAGMRQTGLLILAVACAAMFAGVSGCAGGKGAASRAVEVAHVGEMRAVMREGKSEARVVIAGDIARPHMFAVGAMAGLQGEVTIKDGQVWVTRVVGGAPAGAGPSVGASDWATMLTSASVPAWEAVELDADARGGELEALIARVAGARGLDTAKPFPFRIEGRITSLEMHVVNGYCPHGEGNASESNLPWKFSGEPPEDTSIVGFFAEGAGGVLTHHGTAIHAHAIVGAPEGTLTGHVDAMGVGRGAVLLLPAGSR